MIAVFKVVKNGCTFDFSGGTEKELVFEKRDAETFAQVANRALTGFAEKLMEIARERDVQEAKNA